MLKIGRAQKQALAAESVNRFKLELCEKLLKKGMGKKLAQNELADRVGAGVDQAVKYGFESTAGAELFAELAVLHGKDFCENDWARKIIWSPTMTPVEKLERLEPFTVGSPGIQEE